MVYIPHDTKLKTVISFSFSRFGSVSLQPPRTLSICVADSTQLQFSEKGSCCWWNPCKTSCLYKVPYVVQYRVTFKIHTYPTFMYRQEPTTFYNYLWYVHTFAAIDMLLCHGNKRSGLLLYSYDFWGTGVLF